MEFPGDLLDLLRRVERVAVLTGAGVSKESGLRTFREAHTGLWSQERPEDLATPQAFQRDPRRVWDWYAQRRDGLAAVTPNPGHTALVELARRYRDFTLITQNVDGLHQRAGSRDVIELHGSIARVRCSAGCGVVEAWDEPEEGVPACPRCGALLRPDVVWFGEYLPAQALERAARAARACQVFFSIGTSALVQPAASLAIAARHRGAQLVEINTEATPLSPEAHFILPGPSGLVLPALTAAL